jgi:hypothetical protein
VVGQDKVGRVDGRDYLVNMQPLDTLDGVDGLEKWVLKDQVVRRVQRALREYKERVDHRVQKVLKDNRV